MTVNETSKNAGGLDNLSEFKKKHPNEESNGSDKENYDAELEQPAKRRKSNSGYAKEGELGGTATANNQEDVVKNEDNKELERKKKEAEKAALRQKKLEEKEEAKRKREFEREEEKKRKEAERDQERRRKEAEKEEEKRRKEEEKEEEKRRKEIAKREKEVKKEEERKKKEELRLQKEEEKRKKEEEKEEEKRAKEEDKRAKEAEKQKKEEEKRKKKEQQQKSQMNLSSFFAIQNTKDASKSKEVTSEEDNQLSLENSTLNETERFYDGYFLPFHLRKNVTVGSCNYLTKENDNGDCLSWLKSHKVTRGGSPHTTISSIISMMNDSTLTESDLSDKLKAIPLKFLSFEENIRPPYQGTFSKYCESVACHPFQVVSEDINYDYESDLEWINYEDEEGEDIGDEDSDDGMDDEDEDMDEFLDTEADGVTERGTIMGPLEASVKLNTPENCSTFQQMAIQLLVPCDTNSIDPFKDYWAPKSTIINTKKEPNRSPSVVVKDSAKPVKTVPEDKLTDVLSRVNQSDMSLILLVEIIKRDIPALTKESIRNTIKISAVQQGQKENKRWVVNPEFLKYIA